MWLCLFWRKQCFFVTVRAGTAYRKIWRLVNNDAAYERVRSKVTSRYTEYGSCSRRWPFMWTFSSRRDLLLCRWKTLVTVLDVPGFRRHSGQYLARWARSAVRVHSISEKVSAWRAQQISSAYCIDKPAATCDRKKVCNERCGVLQKIFNQSVTTNSTRQS